MKCVGQNVPRLDGVQKVTGAALYIDDISMPDMWHGVAVRTTIPHGRIKKVELDPGFDWTKVVVADSKDIPGKNCVAMIEEDVPLIVTDRVKHVGEAVLLIAAPTREIALQAREHVKIEYEELVPIFTIEDSQLANVKIRGENNIVAEYTMEKGDAEKGFREADKIVEGIYRTGHQEHIYIEPNGVIAAPREGGGFSIVGSLQCPYYISNAMAKLFNLPQEKFAVRQAVVGGAFGGKEDYPSILAGYAALLSLKAKRPIKIIYERAEDTEVTTKRHPSIVRHKTGVKNDGTITAMEIEVLMDAGAYVTLTPVVLSRGFIHSAGAYRCENVNAYAAAYATNTPPNGAFRGFGAPQTLFAVECQMDKVAAAIGMDPYQFRKKNCFQIGDITVTGQELKESVAALKVLEEAVARSDFKSKFKKYSKEQKGNIRRGVGVSLFLHGAGFTGSGEAKIKGEAGLRLDANGKITVLTACTEMGQGSHTVLPQMAAEELGVDLSCVGIETPDTSLVPNSGPTVASRTTMIMGVVLGKCAKTLKEKLFEYAADKFSQKEKDLKFEGVYLKAKNKNICSVEELVQIYLAENKKLTVIDHYELPPDIKWDDSTYKGDAYPAYAWGCDVAEVEIDQDTFEVRVSKMWMAFDVGRAINPELSKGQIEGGTLQALGYAIMEKHLVDKGHFKTNRLQTYIIPTTLDTPEFETTIIEDPYSNGPMGAKGLGEIPMDGAAPAIANAIANATGIHVYDLPITPEKLYEAWKRKVVIPRLDRGI